MLYCKSCLSKWLKKTGKDSASCPICEPDVWLSTGIRSSNGNSSSGGGVRSWLTSAFEGQRSNSGASAEPAAHASYQVVAVPASSGIGKGAAVPRVAVVSTQQQQQPSVV
jgi:hypothetical protein